LKLKFWANRNTIVETYEVRADCKCCGHTQYLDIPKGKTGMEYANKIKCENCENTAWRVYVY